MSLDHNVSSIGWFSQSPASCIDRTGNYHMATNVDTDPIKKKDNIKGYLKRYAEQVSSADKGAIINK